MNPEMIKVLIILILLIIGLLTRVFSYGITSMLACVALVLVGVADIPTAFSGFSTSTVVLVASMMVVASALGKTSLAHRIRENMNKLQGKNKWILFIAMMLATIALSQLMGQVACLTIILLFVQTLDEKSEFSPARMLFLMVVINAAWSSRIPVGMGATMPFMLNSFYDGMVDEKHLLGIADVFKAGIIPSMVAFVYCLLFYKLIPHSTIKEEDVEEKKEQKQLSKKDESIIFIVFICVTLGFALQKYLGANITNVIPVLGVIVLLLFNTLHRREVMNIVTGEIIWLVAGMQVISKMLSKTGVGELIGETVLKVLGNNPSPTMVLLLFAVVTGVMTNFLSNLGTMAVMTPISASAALVAGIPPQALVLIVGISSWFSFLLPTGSAGSIIGFGIGNYNPFKVMKFTFPLFILMLLALVLNVKIMYGI